MAGTHTIFVRHGETVGNLEQIAHGQTESPLNERGVQQARHAAERLRNWDRTYHRIYCSPMQRAHHTAEIIREAVGLPLHIHDDLKEGFLGDWEGITYEQLDENRFARRSIKDDDFDDHNGESPNVLANRVFGAVTEIRASHPGENIIIVSHGAAISHSMSRIMNTQPAFGYQYMMHNTAVTEVCWHPEPVIERLNDHDHIPEELRAHPFRKDEDARA